MTDTPLSDDVVELCARVIERKFYEYVDDAPVPGAKPFEHIARAALESARYGEPAWQPIETAPKDGTDIDIWVVNEKGHGWRETDASYATDREDEFSDYSLGHHRTLRERRDGWIAPGHGYDGDIDFCDQPVRQCGRPLADTFIKATHWMPLPAPPRALLSSIGASHP